MTIDYVEIRDENRSVIGIIDTAQSVIWNPKYYGVGQFEIYISSTPENVELLKEGNYVSRPDSDEVGIIESIEVSFSVQDGRMIAASGRFAKSILDRRQIYNLSGHTNAATIIRGNVEQQIRKLVEDNAISCSFDASRNIPMISLGPLAGLDEIIKSESGEPAQKQVSYQNLLTYTDSVLEEYGLSAILKLNRDTLMFEYCCYKGADRSVDNADGNEPIIFSQDFDNLTSSEYSLETSAEKNVALIGGQGEGVNRFYSLIGNTSGMQRREVFIDAASISKTYKEGEQEKTYSDSEYNEMLSTHGLQKLAEMTRTESFSGMIEVSGQWVFGRDFFLGDIVTVQDSGLKKYINVRVIGVSEIEDENGYYVSVDYQS